MFFWVELVVNQIILIMALAISIIIRKTYFSFEEGIFTFSIEFNQDQPSIVVNSVIDDFYLWRKTWLHPTDDERFILVLEVIVVWINLRGISRSVYFERFDIIGKEGDLKIEGWREIGKIEVLKNIFFDIILIDCTKVIESFNIFEFFTNFRSKLIRNSYDSQSNSSFRWSFLKKNSLIGDAIVTDISQHDDSVLAIMALMLQNKLIKHVLRLFKTVANSSSSSWFDWLQFIKSFIQIQLIDLCLLDYNFCLIIESNQTKWVRRSQLWQKHSDGLDREIEARSVIVCSLAKTSTHWPWYI